MNFQQNGGALDTVALHAWLSREPDGTEGIICAMLGAVYLPLVFTEESRARRFAGHARHAAAQHGQNARLVKFARTETLLEVAPPAAN